MDKLLDEKYSRLKIWFSEANTAVVAYSGGVDSTLLLKVAFNILGDKVTAVMGKSASMPEQDYKEAIEVARKIGVEPVVLETKEIGTAIYKSNPVDRCYHCKKVIFGTFLEYIQEHKLNNLVDGSNVDDLKDYRPGKKALEELKVQSPLKESGFTKNDIRALSKELNLPTWEKEAMACLSTRIAYGDEITVEKLKMVEKAEVILRNLGFKNVRARVKGEDVKIEVNKTQIAQLFNDTMINKVVKDFKAIGFKSVSVDLEGYKMGGGVLIDNEPNEGS